MALLALAAGDCGGGSGTPPRSDARKEQSRAAAAASAAPAPPELTEGERLFNADCAPCHGSRATGTDHGPPLVHVIYEPNHHSDAAFQRAVALGSRAHHWTFGDMPPVSGVSPDDVTQITAYVRWLQRRAGIGIGE